MTLNRIYFVCLRSLPTLCTLRKPLLTLTINTVTGHGTFQSHVSKLNMCVNHPAQCAVHAKTQTYILFSNALDITTLENSNLPKSIGW